MKYDIITATSFILYMIAMAGLYMMFEKADRPGWHALILGLNFYDVADITTGIGLLGCLVFLPFVGWTLGLILSFNFMRRYDIPMALAIFGIFFPTIVYPIIGFGSYQYIGNHMPDVSEYYENEDYY